MDGFDISEAFEPPNNDRTLFIRQQVATEQLEALVALIIAKLDELGIDADFEPVLGAPELSPYQTTAAFREGLDQRDWCRGGDADEREPAGDDEPSLGSVHGTAASVSFGSQERWVQGGAADMEDEHDGREPQCEDEGAQCDDEGHQGDLEPDSEGEPWLGSLERGHGGTSWGPGCYGFGVLDGEVNETDAREPVHG